MSFAQVLPYFRSVCKAKNLEEWNDAYNKENIPASKIDKSFHLTFGQSTNIKQNQDVIEVSQPVEVGVVLKAFRNTDDGRNRAITLAESIIKAALVDELRAATYSGIKNVTFDAGSVDAYSNDNDNLLVITLNFTCHLMMASS